VSREHGKHGCQDGNQIGHQVQAQDEPPLGTIGYVHVDRVLVDVLLHLLDERALCRVGFDGRHARQRLTKMREYGRFGGRVQAGYLPRRAHIIALNENVQQRGGNDQGEREGRAIAEYDERVHDVQYAKGDDLERVGHEHLDGLHVACEPVDYAAHGRRLEEVQRAVQNGHEQFAVEQSSGSYVHEHEENVRNVQRDALKKAEYEVNEQTEVLVVERLSGCLVAPRAQPQTRGGHRARAQYEKEKEARYVQQARLAHVLDQDGNLDGSVLDVLLFDDFVRIVLRLLLALQRVQRVKSTRGRLLFDQHFLGLVRVAVTRRAVLVRLDVLFARLVVGQEQLDEVGKRAVSLSQIVVLTHFRNGAIVQHDHLVALRQKAQRIGHKQPRLVLEHAIGTNHRVEYALAHMRIDRTQRVVQHVNLGVRVQRSSQTDALFLPTGQVDAFLAYFRLVSGWHYAQIGSQ